MPNTNAMAVAVAVPISNAKAILLADVLPTANLNAQIHSYFC